MMRDGEVATLVAHNHHTVGSSPTPATNRLAVLASVVSHRRPSISRVAQRLELSTDNRQAVSSSLTSATNRLIKCADSSASGERQSYKLDVGGSIPSLRTMRRSFNGRTSAFQVDDASSSLARRTNRERIRSSMVELSAHNRSIAGSIPVGSTSRSIPPAWVGGATVAHRTFNPMVASSILARPTSRVIKHGLVAQMAEHPALNRNVVGSMPTGSTILETSRQMLYPMVQSSHGISCELGSYHEMWWVHGSLLPRSSESLVYRLHTCSSDHRRTKTRSSAGGKRSRSSYRRRQAEQRSNKYRDIEDDKRSFEKTCEARINDGGIDLCPLRQGILPQKRERTGSERLRRIILQSFVQRQKERHQNAQSLKLTYRIGLLSRRTVMDRCGFESRRQLQSTNDQGSVVQLVGCRAPTPKISVQIAADLPVDQWCESHV